jgi:hypothetical protein
VGHEDPKSYVLGGVKFGFERVFGSEPQRQSNRDTNKQASQANCVAAWQKYETCVPLPERHTFVATAGR